MSLISRLRRHKRRSLARIAVNLEPRPGPYGGGNQFVSQLRRHLELHGYEVVFRLDDAVRVLIMIDGRSELTSFDADDVRAFKTSHPHAVCLHRINECDQRKATQHMDEILARTNTVADHTVFVSAWLRDYHTTRWFDSGKPHCVIWNGADPRHFHPLGQQPLGLGQTFRLVTHHWSDNPRKGFPVYEEIDRQIASGALANLELWVIGRWPAELSWRSARVFPPKTGAQLAELLRQCHGYVTASLWDPGPMHLVEGLQCGLPVLYHLDGGGIVEVARRFGVGFRDDVVAGVEQLRRSHTALRERVLSEGPSGDSMCVEYRRAIQCLLATRTANR